MVKSIADISALIAELPFVNGSGTVKSRDDAEDFTYQDAGQHLLLAGRGGAANDNAAPLQEMAA